MGVGGRSRLATSEGPARELLSPLGGRRSAACRRTGLAGVPSTGGTPGPCKGLSPISSGATWLISRGALWKQALGGGSCEARERPWAAAKHRSELRQWERDGGGRLGVERGEGRLKERCGFWNFPDMCGFESGTLKLYASARCPLGLSTVLDRHLSRARRASERRVSGACALCAPGPGAAAPPSDSSSSRDRTTAQRGHRTRRVFTLHHFG